jgi:hypothetical protein
VISPVRCSFLILSAACEIVRSAQKNAGHRVRPPLDGSENGNAAAQYSSANMIVMTRWVTDGSDEWPMSALS